MKVSPDCKFLCKARSTQRSTLYTTHLSSVTATSTLLNNTPRRRVDEIIKLHSESKRWRPRSVTANMAEFLEAILVALQLGGRLNISFGVIHLESSDRGAIYTLCYGESTISKPSASEHMALACSECPFDFSTWWFSAFFLSIWRILINMKPNNIIMNNHHCHWMHITHWFCNQTLNKTLNCWVVLFSSMRRQLNKIGRASCRERV